MYVCNGFTIEIYGFTHSLCSFLVHAAHDAEVKVVEDSEDRRGCPNKSRDTEDG